MPLDERIMTAPFEDNARISLEMKGLKPNVIYSAARLGLASLCAYCGLTTFKPHLEDFAECFHCRAPFASDMPIRRVKIRSMRPTDFLEHWPPKERVQEPAPDGKSCDV